MTFNAFGWAQGLCLPQWREQPSRVSSVPSAASDAVMDAEHPSHADGGPCHDCAFRRGTNASQSEHTVELARLCVESFREFKCHVHPGPCRGFIAALNLRGAPTTEDDQRWCEAAGLAADLLGDAIDAAVKADRDAQPISHDEFLDRR